MRPPVLYSLDGLVHVATDGNKISADGKTYYPARPVGNPALRYRLKAAWFVLTGKADAVIWPADQ